MSKSSSLLSRLAALVLPRPENRVLLPALDAGESLIYAVGDLHGCRALYRDLEAMIVADAQSFGLAPIIVLLGDMIDRGPDSAGLLDDLTSPAAAGLRRVAVMGNHEAMMLEFLASPKKNATWLSFGGTETLASYGLQLDEADVQRLSERRLQQIFEAHIPESHRSFLSSLPFGFTQGSLVFVHAGINPGYALDEQPQDAVLLGAGVAEPVDGLIVVQGHIVVTSPDLSQSRIMVDTGAYKTGILSAVRLGGNQTPSVLTCSAVQAGKAKGGPRVEAALWPMPQIDRI